MSSLMSSMLLGKFATVPFLRNRSLITLLPGPTFAVATMGIVEKVHTDFKPFKE